jgi:hypothetical protein
MKLYIANCTHQTRILNHRLVEGKARGFSTQTIVMGRQEMIAGEMNRHQIDYIISQHRPYGLLGVEEIDGVTHEVPMVFSIDKPVSAKLMQQLITHNSLRLKEIGSRLRRDAAIATSHGMREFSPAAAETVSLSVEEEKAGTMDHGGDQPLAEGFRMTRDAAGA